MKKVLNIFVAAFIIIVLSYGLGAVCCLLFPNLDITNTFALGLFILGSFCASFAFFALVADDSKAV